MNNPVVSIILAIWNVEPYIHKCLDSILNQTYKELEIILVDDGSPDNCPAICDEYAAKDTRIKVIHKPNGGVSAARQDGLDAATGDYIIFLDPDDYVERDMIKCLVEKAEETGADMVTSNFFFNDGSVCDCHYDGVEELLKKTILREMRAGLWNMLVNRHFIVENKLSFVPSWLCHSEDYLFTTRLLVAGGKPVHINRAFYHYIFRGGGLFSSRSKKAFNSITTYISEIENLVDVSKYDNLFRLKRYAYIYAYESRYFSEMKDLFLDIRKRLLEGKDSERYSIDSQLSRCMKYPPILVWVEAKIHKYLQKLTTRQQ